MRKTIKSLLVEYGTVAVVVHLTIFAIVLAGFWTAIAFGWRPASVAGKTGTFLAAYGLTQLTKPIRFFLTLALTPFIAKIYERVTGRVAAKPPPPA